MCSVKSNMKKWPLRADELENKICKRFILQWFFDATKLNMIYLKCSIFKKKYSFKNTIKKNLAQVFLLTFGSTLNFYNRLLPIT